MATLVIVPWLAIVTKKFESGWTREFFTLIALTPLLLLAMFGLVSVAIIAYRVYTFNDCSDASEELQRQIVEAKKDLTKKGFVFDKEGATS